MRVSANFERLHAVLVGTRNPLNLGAAARAMSNFGFAHLRVVNPYAVAFREARSAVGATAVLESAIEYTTVADAVADCTLVVGTTAGRKRELHHELYRLEQGARLIRQELTQSEGRVALLFGSEKVGLGNADLSHCHWLMRVPTGKGHASMNLGQAVAVCLYELVRDSTAASSPGKMQRANASEMERIITVLLEVLGGSGYVNQGSAAETQLKVRRLIRRLNLNAADADVLLGMLRQILWKVRR